MQAGALLQQQQQRGCCGRRRTRHAGAAPSLLQTSRGPPGRGDALVCLAHPRRVAKVSSQIQREIADMFVSDPVLQEAISPGRANSVADALSAVASVTHVYVSNDLQVVKAYVSVYSDERGKRRALANLRRLQPYVRRQIGSRVRLRLTPEVRFEYDDSIEEAEAVARVIGDEDFNRYLREAEEEADAAENGAWASVRGDTAAAAAGDGDGGAEGDENEEEGGFFDELEEDDEEEAYAEEEEFEEQYGDDWLSWPGPFDDMFAADGEELQQAAPRAEGHGSGRGGGGSGRVGRGGQQQQQQQRQQQRHPQQQQQQPQAGP